jgi:hypothetical protein
MGADPCVMVAVQEHALPMIPHVVKTGALFGVVKGPGIIACVSLGRPHSVVALEEICRVGYSTSDLNDLVSTASCRLDLPPTVVMKP